MAKSDVVVRILANTQGYDPNIAKARRQLDQFKKDNLSLGGVLKQTQGALLATAARFASVTAAVSALGSAFMDNIATARKFELSMSQLSSLTGMMGKDLEKLKGYAIELGSSTTLTASEVAEAFKMIGSQQPQLLASGEALKAVTKEAITLSEAAGIELATAAQTLSTSINQMGGDSNNATRFVNVLAAASQKGAGDIAWLGEAVTKSGTAAKAVGTDFEELVANLEQLAKAGFDASTAGTALRSIIMNLEKQANNDFKPSIVGLTQAFENLGKANLTIVDYQKITGKMFASQAMALADAAGEAKKMTEAITGTNIAEEQAKINTNNLDGALKSLSSAWEGLNLHINDSNGPITTFVNNLTQAIRKADAAVMVIKTLWKYMKGERSSNESDGNVNTNAITEIPEVVIQGRKGSGGGGGGASGKNKNKTQKTEWQLNNDAIEKLTQEYIKASQERQAEIRNEIKVLQDRNALIQQMENEAKGKMTGANLGHIEAVSGASVTGSTNTDPLEKYKKDLPSVITPLQQLEDHLKELIRLQAEFGGMSTEAWQKYQNEIEKTQNEIKDFKGISNDGKDVAKSWRTAASAISTVGSAMSGLKNPAIDIMTVIGQSIATIALSYAENLAGDRTTKGNIWAFIAAAAAATVSMATTIASIHSATGYAQGGEVKGNSYSGDNIPIMANAGEVVLTAAMTNNLANGIQNRGFGNMNIVGVLEGEKIKLVLNRHLKRTGQGELVTWR